MSRDREGRAEPGGERVGDTGPRSRTTWVEHPHPVHRVHRLGAGVLGVGLIVFGGLGLADRPEFFSGGRQVMGMGSNGALAVISLAVGVLLLVAAVRGGRRASTTTLVVGALFLLSGFVHLAVLDTAANLLAFRLPNVMFSFGAGLLLLTLGAYGRITGGLPPDNPYARRGALGSVAPAVLETGPEDGDREQIVRAEQAAASTGATPEQRTLLRMTGQRRAQEDYDRAWRAFAAGHSAAETSRLRATAEAESALLDAPGRKPRSPH